MTLNRRDFLRLTTLSALGSIVSGKAQASSAPGAASVLVEAERFTDKGGWSVDPQFTHAMGSPFLLAHGMGVPVADAVTQAELPEAGEWHVWVRTRDWAREWSDKAPGRFRLLINGTALPETLGTASGTWGWQKAGSLKLPAGTVTLTLHDLTGFDGRCDAIFLSKETSPQLPETLPELEAFRRRHGTVTPPKQVERYDLVVAGAGIAGICAAISAARLGLRVALFNDHRALGGCNSSGIRVGLSGNILTGLHPKLGQVVAEIGPAKGGNAGPAERYEDERKLAAVKAEPNITLITPARLVAAKANNGHVCAVRVRHTEMGAERQLEAPLFVDATGDGALGAMVGADFRYGRESRAETGEKRAPEKGDRQVMGASVMWYSVSCAEGAEQFPDMGWNLPFTEKTCEKVTRGDWDWETGMLWDQVAEAERVHNYGLAVIYANWAFLKNHYSGKAKYATRRLGWVAFLAGKRERRRLMGDVVLSETDVVGRKAFPDACLNTSWSMDLHFPEATNAKHFPKGPFKSKDFHSFFGKSYPIPYRCLYSRNIDNLFMAGRDISVTHVALGTVRVMRTCGMMGEVVGMGAAVCQRKRVSPRGVYEKELDELKALMVKGVGNGKPQPPQRYSAYNP